MPAPTLLIHPGEILADELEAADVSPHQFSRQIAIPAGRLDDILQGRSAITGDAALRFGHWFGTQPQFWLNLQAAYDLRVAEAESGEEIAKLPTRGIAA